MIVSYEKIKLYPEISKIERLVGDILSEEKGIDPNIDDEALERIIEEEGKDFIVSLLSKSNDYYEKRIKAEIWINASKELSELDLNGREQKRNIEEAISNRFIAYILEYKLKVLITSYNSESSHTIGKEVVDYESNWREERQKEIDRYFKLADKLVEDLLFEEDTEDTTNFKNDYSNFDFIPF